MCPGDFVPMLHYTPRLSQQFQKGRVVGRLLPEPESEHSISSTLTASGWSRSEKELSKSSIRLLKRSWCAFLTGRQQISIAQLRPQKLLLRPGPLPVLLSASDTCKR